MTEMTHLSSLFSEKIGIDADFYLTEEDFQSQRFLFAGIEQLRELLEMKKAGMFEIETVLLTEAAPVYFEKEKDSLSSITGESIRAAIIGSTIIGSIIIGLVLIERQPSGNPTRNDTGNCLVFTPAVSDAGTIRAFQSILSEMAALPSAGDTPVHQLQVSKKELADDVIEYYSKTALAFFHESEEMLPSYDSVYSESRVQKAAETLRKMSGLPAVKESGRAFLAPGFNVLEICCGNGMSTLGLYEEGVVPLSVDINAEDICIGLAHNVLKPAKTILMDATTLSRNLDSETFDTVIGFMIGTIYEFNKNLWFSIVGEALEMLKPGGFLLLTLRAEHEAVWVSDHLKSKGVVGEIIDNRDNLTNYDEWIYFARK